MKAKLVNRTAWGNLVLMCLLSATWQMQAQDNKAPIRAWRRSSNT